MQSLISSTKHAINPKRILYFGVALVLSASLITLVKPRKAEAACSSTNSFGRIEATFTIPSDAAANYTVWVQAKGSINANLAVGVDDKACVSKTTTTTVDTWTWQAINQSSTFPLTAGPHTLHVSAYTADTKIQNALVINNDCNPNTSPDTCATQTTVTNTAPTLSSLTVNNASPSAPATMTFTVTASDTTGSISKVELLNSTTQSVIGQMTPTGIANQYNLSVNNYAAGSYSFIAKATDNGSPALTTNSNALSVQVAAATPNSPPTITLAINTTSITTAQTTVLGAVPKDSDGTIDRVEIYRNNSSSPLATLRGNYSYTISNYLAGTYTFIAKAFDNNGAVANSNTVTLNVTQAQTTDSIPPSAPTSITTTISYDWWVGDCVPTNNCQITITWAGASDNLPTGVKSYDIYRSLNGQTATKINTTPVTGTSFTETGISKDNQYTYSIVAYDAAGNQSNAGVGPKQTVNCWWILCGLQ